MERAQLGEQPLVSIITPSYNQGHLIEATILSIKYQTYRNVEHIICDAGSTDETLDVIRKHEGTYNVRWVSEPDDGQADAINKGFDMARGEIVTWINSDDVYVSREAVSKVVEAFRAYPAADVVTGNGVYIDQESRWLHPAPRPRKSHVCRKHLRYGNCLIQPATFFRRHVTQDCRCDPTLHYSFDWDLFIRIAGKYNLLPIDDIIVGFRVHPASKTGTPSTAHLGEKREVTRRYLGARSPQYLARTCLYIMFRATDLLPKPLRLVMQRALSKVSAWINVLTFGRLS